MTETMSRVTLHIAVACCVLAGCETEDEPAAVPAVAPDSIAADAVFRPAEDRVNLPTSRIYYTLTSHEWYARGEPLVHEGRPHEPVGMPLPVSLTEMTKAGEYQGVDYYVRDGDTGAAVYVPVFDGYWQMFLADPSAVPARVDTGADAPPDTSTAPA
jgi:hypothetical protein